MQKKKLLLSLLCGVALLGVLCTCVGVTYARFKTQKEGGLTFEAKPINQSGTVVISSAEGWVTTGEQASLRFTLSGTGGGVGRKATLCLTATETFGGGTVTLTVDGTEYVGAATVIAPEDLLYAQMGGGTLYRFYNRGEELVWPLSPNKSMELTVQGVAQTTLLRLIAEEK